MRKLQIAIAIDRYDYIHQFLDGQVQPAGIDLRFIEDTPAGVRHERMFENEEYDACEFALGGHILAASRGQLLGRAIPVFPRRMFPHKFFVVRTDSGIESPKDLAGKKVGIVSYENTLQIPMRAALHHQYGLPRDAVRWVAPKRGMVGIDRVHGARLEITDEWQSVQEGLMSGKLDALVIPYIINPIIQGDPRVRSLFPDPKAQELKYFQATGHFPIMHDLLIKQSVLERHPWVANSLLDAFRLARRRHREWLEQPPNLSFAWGRELMHEERLLFGPEQWEDGFKANLKQLQLSCQYAHEQGMTDTVVDPSSLFAPSTLDS